MGEPRTPQARDATRPCHRRHRAGFAVALVALAVAGNPTGAHPRPAKICLPKGAQIAQYTWTAGEEPPAGLPSAEERAAWSKEARAKLPETIVRDGSTFRRAGRVRIDVPLRRYYPSQAPVEGLPAVAPLASRGKVILVLTGPSGCWFQRFVADPASGSEPRAPD